VVVNQDGTYFFLSNDNNLAQNYIKNIEHSSVFFRNYLDCEGSYDFIFWPNQPINSAMQIYYEHGYWNGFSLSSPKKEDGSMEIMCFLSDKENININNFYFKNYGLLEKFANNFKEQFIDDIALVPGDKKLAKFSQGVDLYIPEKKIENYQENVNLFLKATNLDGCKVNINGKNIRITPREKRCLELMSQGWSLKNIGKELLISPRTAETHISNIKQKTGYHYKQDLIKMHQDYL
jgi:DNA-binding CsgD family transcriptional regulator